MAPRTNDTARRRLASGGPARTCGTLFKFQFLEVQRLLLLPLHKASVPAPSRSGYQVEIHPPATPAGCDWTQTRQCQSRWAPRVHRLQVSQPHWQATKVGAA